MVGAHNHLWANPTVTQWSEKKNVEREKKNKINRNRVLFDEYILQREVLIGQQRFLSLVKLNEAKKCARNWNCFHESNFLLR